ncbi:MAG: undecaprenyldiphospho-muramoylpentapeptide beta-N-acetylglucosaminyltransferase [Eubacteriaceae bacterium]|jgi:UDP-N-acetylglucosamine--N-acetylmuramyl-(pentapeptide) pyrophosphoryl-undecaprenol N-acetylglucosamine transferase|nr:undecaprenyldiphospho-muramoylpentapeptide beta-N-acetylglucosaminyltransferase [Eubacteriaceae bacterium]
MKILIAAGGTGGHIFPGLAIADALKKKREDCEIVFIGSQVGMEKNIVPQYGYPLEMMRVRGFERQFSLQIFAALKGLLDGAIDVRRVLKRHQPDLVIGTGGFTSGQLLLKASQMGIPTLIHEQNAYPGQANRILAKYVDRVAISFYEAARYFPDEKTFLSGNPVRDAFKNIDRHAARHSLHLNPNQKLILISGGSQGAESINRAVLSLYERYKGHPTYRFIQLTGEGPYEDVLQAMAEQGITKESYDNIEIYNFSNQMETLMGAADLMITRSGAGTISEIAAVGVPSVLIPFPLAAGNHQEFNARVLTDKGAGILLYDQQLNGETLLKTFDRLFEKEETLSIMRLKTLRLRKTDADELIAKEALKLLI